jgi:hypothetical protein
MVKQHKRNELHHYDAWTLIGDDPNMGFCIVLFAEYWDGDKNNINKVIVSALDAGMSGDVIDNFTLIANVLMNSNISVHEEQ